MVAEADLQRDQFLGVGNMGHDQNCPDTHVDLVEEVRGNGGLNLRWLHRPILGAFYAHFGSKEELQAAAVAYGQKVSLERAQHSNAKNGKGSYADRYLSRWHRDNAGDGCTMAALGPEVARSTPELKAAFEQGLEDILSASRGDRNEAIFQIATKIVAIILARAVQDQRLSDEILKSVRQKLD